jgi:hypothetical protein
MTAPPALLNPQSNILRIMTRPSEFPLESVPVCRYDIIAEKGKPCCW